MGEARRGSPEEVLVLSWALLEAGRTTAWAARRGNGRTTALGISPYHPEACRFCAVGSVLRAVYELTGQRIDDALFVQGTIRPIEEVLPPVAARVLAALNAALAPGWAPAGDTIIDFHDTPGRKTWELARVWSAAYAVLEAEQLL